ncbi:MAG: hypothetical protein LBS55_12515 [Prevotellaceae bacterium]|jgi:hypothetical protein|nr:hypothetical protein [Prevotellaceae bacterium]
MKRIDLSETEKKVLKALSEAQYECDDSMFSDLSREELNAASERLNECGLIIAHYAGENGGMLAFAMISDKGQVYLKENPALESPVSDNELKRLQIDDLKYKKRIRSLENVIRFWKFASAIIGLTGLLGWLLYLFKIRQYVIHFFH